MASGLVTEPYWWEAAPPKALPAKAVQPSCDAVVVGSGYAGMSAALVLARARLSVQNLDKQRPGEGASSRNGGLASGNIRIGFGEMIEAMGLATARRVYGECKIARTGLAAFIDTENIDCDYQRVGRFIGAVRPSLVRAAGPVGCPLEKMMRQETTEFGRNARPVLQGRFEAVRRRHPLRKSQSRADKNADQGSTIRQTQAKAGD